MGSLLVVITVHKGLIGVVIVALLLPPQRLILAIVIIIVATALGIIACPRLPYSCHVIHHRITLHCSPHVIHHLLVLRRHLPLPSCHVVRCPACLVLSITPPPRVIQHLLALQLINFDLIVAIIIPCHRPCYLVVYFSNYC
jgi:hypothetical protein